ncbi:MAG: OmpA family protein [Spirochaetes bacterium]|nr:OmpA family protein [Spirochaetota bacterium]
MNHRQPLLFAFVFLLVLAISVSCAKKDVSEISLPAGKSARIVFLVGDVSIKRDDTAWVKAEIGDVLEEGALIRTGPESYCEIVLGSGTLFRMKNRSELLIALLPSEDGGSRSLVRLIKGELFAKAQKIAYRSTDSIQTESVTLSVRGTEFLVEKDIDGTGVLVKGGAVRVRMNVTEYASQDLPRGLGGIVRRIGKGVAVRGGYEITVEKRTVKDINEMLEGIVDRKSVSPEEIIRLKQTSVLRPGPLTAENKARLEEIETLSLSYVIGPTFQLSPNFDGVNDDYELETMGIDEERAFGWKLVIRDHSLKTVKTMVNRPVEGQTLVGIPETIGWNMVGDDGNIIGDGNYVYELYTKKKDGSYSMRVKGRIVVDTVVPFLIIAASDITFSPNGDGVKDTVTVEITAEENVDWSCRVTTPEGIVVKTIEWGKDLPAAWEWDGTGENGAVLPEGVYNITITGKDGAGNTTTGTVKEVTLDIRQRQASVDVDNPVFSPNGDGLYDTVTFRPVLSDRSRIDTWDLIVQTEKGETAKRFRGRRYIPESIKWDGAPQRGEKLPKELASGRYFYFLKVIYRSGVNTYSFKKELVLDNDPPEIGLAVEPSLFSPDGDGKDDVLVIRPEISDLTGISGWKATVYTSTGSVFKTFSGTNRPKDEIRWDGVSAGGVLVDSGEDYSMVFEATDAVNNKSKSESVPFSIDILVIPTERGLKIQVSNIEFGFNNADLKGDKTFKILDKIVYVLQKYDRYSIIVEGHTDSTGNEEYNKTLSKNRAESVGRYLTANGIDGERLSFEGRGSQYPVDTNETPEGRARNRRVEFILVRK